MNAIDLFSKKYSNYKARISKTKQVLDYARNTSKEEILFNLEKLIKHKDLRYRKNPYDDYKFIYLA